MYNENTIDSYKRLEYPPATAPDYYRSQYFNDDKIMIGQTDEVDFDYGDPPYNDTQLKTLQFANYVVDKGMPISPADQEHLYRDFNVCGPGKWYSATREKFPSYSTII